MRLSLDELDRQSFHAGPPLIETVGKQIVLQEGAVPKHPDAPYSLNGEWEFLQYDGSEEPVEKDWEDAFPGEVPCGIHMALLKAGRIPDPMVGKNQVIARELSQHDWWLRKKFSFDPQDGKRYRICFEGIADRCTIWLNGKHIASHQGMFGGPDVDITDLLERENLLVVKLERIPFRPWGTRIPGNNKSWADTVVINNVYGWHYFNMPSLGIWRPVTIQTVPAAELESPFIFTRNADTGEAGLVVDIVSETAEEATLQIGITPHNFSGCSWFYEENICLEEGRQEKRYEFRIPEPRAWWPNDLGDPNLYELTVALKTGDSISSYRHLFGLRTIRMEPLPQGPAEDLYNWSFVINDKKVFVKGANWCTLDALLDLRRERYDRYLSLARMQHIQILRAWGAGMPETDDFYELCSEYGIMVLQEWPTAWDSHKEQPVDILKDTVERNTRRIRNFPALVMYGAGNESPDPYGEAIDMMGRLSIELDGTRPYHRGQPWGGSQHDYDSYWDGQHVDHHLTATAPFWGEFGFASIPAYETFVRYMPKESLKVFPLENNPDFVMHTPCFGYRQDINHITQSAKYFLPRGYSWKEFITASQLIHALAVRRVLERSRARNPDCAGVIYYKMTDNSPAVSWACVDYYGVPKIAHYVFQDSFEPLHACVLFERTSFQNMPLALPVYLLDDADELPEAGWSVTVRAYNSELACIAEKAFTQRENRGKNVRLGTFDLSMYQTDSTPLLIVCDVRVSGALRSRSFYFSNFEQDHGCMFRLPRASVRMTSESSSTVTLQNTGELPAIGVWLTAPNKNDVAVFSDNFLWLDAGETRTITVSGVNASEVEVEALNLL